MHVPSLLVPKTRESAPPPPAPALHLNSSKIRNTPVLKFAGEPQLTLDVSARAFPTDGNSRRQLETVRVLGKINETDDDNQLNNGIAISAPLQIWKTFEVECEGDGHSFFNLLDNQARNQPVICA